MSTNLLAEDLAGELTALVVEALIEGRRSGEASVARSDASPAGHGTVAWSRGTATFTIAIPTQVRWDLRMYYEVQVSRSRARIHSFGGRLGADLRSRPTSDLIFVIPPGNWLQSRSRSLASFEHRFLHGLSATFLLTLGGQSIDFFAGSFLHTVESLLAFASDPEPQNLVILPDDVESPIELERAGSSVAITVEEYGRRRTIAGSGEDLLKVVRVAAADLAVITDRRNPRILELDRMRWLRQVLPQRDVDWRPREIPSLP